MVAYKILRCVNGRKITPLRQVEVHNLIQRPSEALDSDYRGGCIHCVPSLPAAIEYASSVADSQIYEVVGTNLIFNDQRMNCAFSQIEYLRRIM